MKQRQSSPGVHAEDCPGPLFRFVRAVCRGYLGGSYAITGEPIPEGAAVYIVHHQNAAGPVQVMASWPRHLCLWVFYPFFEKKTAIPHYARVTFGESLGGRRWWTVPAAWLCGHLAPRLIRSAGAIPVYRGDARIRRTFRCSMDALKAGHGVLIAPDIDYKSSDELIGEIYTGFLTLGGLYRRAEGKPLPFVPIYCDRKARTLVVGRGVYLKEEDAQGQRDAAQALLEEMRRLYGNARKNAGEQPAVTSSSSKAET